jgi:hypothetical protein
MSAETELSQSEKIDTGSLRFSYTYFFFCPGTAIYSSSLSAKANIFHFYSVI